MMTDDSKIRLQQFFNQVNVILTNTDNVGQIIDEFKKQHNETVDNMRWRDAKLLSLEIECQFMRLITKQKINRDDSMSELLTQVDNMTSDEIISLMS